MINTIDTKAAQLRDGYYQSGTGPKQILILGSCRTLAYLSYLADYNKGTNELTIRRIDPCDWAVSGVDINSLENDERILSVLKSCDIFIHEYLVNWGMFNTTIQAEKNIYQFGLDDADDIAVPNFNDHLILENDWIDYGAASTPDDYIQRGNKQIEKFCAHAELSSVPEFAQTFFDTWKTIRYFWRPNHVSAAFTKAIFKLINDKFLHLPITEVTNEDLFASPRTQVTQRDRDGYQLQWN